MVTIKLTFIGALLFASFGCGGRSAPRVSLLREIPPGKYEVTYNLVGSKIETKFQLAVTSLPLSNQNNIYVGNVPFQNRIWSFDLGNFDNSATLLSDFNEIYITFVIQTGITIEEGLQLAGELVDINGDYIYGTFRGRDTTPSNQKYEFRFVRV